MAAFQATVVEQFQEVNDFISSTLLIFNGNARCSIYHYYYSDRRAEERAAYELERSAKEVRFLTSLRP